MYLKRSYYAADIAPVNPLSRHRVNFHQLLVQLISVPPGRLVLKAVSELAYCNLFSPARVEYEREILGTDFELGGAVWSLDMDDPDRPLANDWKVYKRVEDLLESLRRRLESRVGWGAGPRRRGCVWDSSLWPTRHLSILKRTRTGVESVAER